MPNNDLLVKLCEYSRGLAEWAIREGSGEDSWGALANAVSLRMDSIWIGGT